MISEEIKKIAIDSSKTYYDFLAEAGRGIEEVRVASISQKKEIFKLILERKLFNLDAIYFLVNAEKIDTSRIKVIEYDNDTNTLLIKPEPNLQERFSGLRADDIKIISDLKFLVKRVQDWYETNGEKIQLPIMSSRLEAPSEDIFFSGQEPSQDQRQAIESIFNNPLTYVWGAPGTGKTQLALAYSLINYVKADKQIAIFAATNNALEQILYGVLNMTEQADIKDNKILRLGTPSSKFAQLHPDSCETFGVQQKVGELDNQIKILRDVMESNKVTHLLASIEAGTKNIFSQLKNLEGSREELLVAIKSIDADLDVERKIFNETRLEIAEIEREIRQIERKIRSLFYRFGRKFLNSPSKEANLLSREDDLAQTTEKNNSQKAHIVDLESKRESLKVAYEDLSEVSTLLAELKSICVDEESKKIVSDITLENYGAVRDDLQNYLDKRNADLESAQIIAPEYANWSEQDLVDRLNLLEQQKGKLESETEERIKDANIIALTLDCYIGRYNDKDLPGEHYFLDEAGYACLIKALTLFRKDAPITFLGDHKQLPPVCEFDDRLMADSESNKNVSIWAQSALYAEWMFVKTKEEVFQDYSRNNPYSFVRTIKSDLRETYRFGSALAQKLDQFVYNNGFVAHSKNGETEIYYIHASHITPQPFSNFNGRRVPSRENLPEAQKVIELLNILDKENFAILTPYKNQVTLLGQMLPEARRDQKILTVHGSQGKEWNDVVLSVVDTDRMWFVDTLKRESRGLNVVNTAVSRAKKRLFVVCNYNFWMRQEGQLIKGLLDVAQQTKL